MKVGEKIQYFAMFLSFRFSGSGVRIPVEARDFLFSSETFKLALRSTQPPIRWIPGSFHGMKAAGACSAEVKDAWN
jgi:hypothetical protein